MKRVKLILGTILSLAGLIGCGCESSKTWLQVAIYAGVILCFYFGFRLLESSGLLK